MAGLRDLLRIDRARHFLVALVVAAALGAIGFFSPLDWFIWSSHARIVERQASGEIVFIGGTGDLSDPTRPQHRRDLATLIKALSDAGAERIFLDVRLEKPSTAAADEGLRRAIEDSNRTYLVDRFKTTVTGPRMHSTVPAIAGTAPRLIAKHRLNSLGWAWSADRGSVDDGIFRQSFAGALADVPPEVGGDFRIDYSVDFRSVPSIGMSEALNALAAGQNTQLFNGRFIVVGNGGGGDSAYAAIPGHPRVPASMIAILGGETLRAGPPTDVGWIATLLAFATILAGVLLVGRHPRIRYAGYAFTVLVLPTWFLFTAYFRITAHLSVPIAFLAIYGAGRVLHRRNRNSALVDELSGLPSFRALENDLARQTPLAPVCVVVARIHRFDEVLAILQADSHGEYVRQVAERFRITEKGLTVYSNAGRYLAWLQQAEDEAQLEAHLHGLRAVFANPLYVDGTPLDVGITFGADATREMSPSRKIASATAAVDRTTESHLPVLLADKSSVSERMWNVSLQAKIDAALKGGQIYAVYQPQFDLPGETLCGFEALVRWNDPERGPIAPSYFIEQCEHAGRMEALTRKVFEESIWAISQSPFAKGPYGLSINVSATMLADDRVLDILDRSLASSNLEAGRLTIEITETARIPDLDHARLILKKLQALGVRTSIDDFGVGAANLETLLRLPFNELKIDRVFVARMRDEPKARQIVRSLIELGKGVGVDVVAEGVEDRVTLELLKSFGCGGVQGYLLGKPDRLSASEKHLSTGGIMAAPGAR